jgi:hypothetical protein
VIDVHERSFGTTEELEAYKLGVASMDLEIIDVDKSCFYYTSQN